MPTQDPRAVTVTITTVSHTGPLPPAITPRELCELINAEVERAHAAAGGHHVPVAAVPLCHPFADGTHLLVTCLFQRRETR